MFLPKLFPPIDEMSRLSNPNTFRNRRVGHVRKTNSSYVFLDESPSSGFIQSTSINNLYSKSKKTLEIRLPAKLKPLKDFECNQDDVRTEKKCGSSIVRKIRSLSSLVSSTIEDVFLSNLIEFYNSQESLPMGVISFDKQSNILEKPSFFINLPGEGNNYLYEDCCNKVELFFNDLSLRDKVLKVLILVGLDIFGRNNQSLGKQEELKSIVLEHIDMSVILNVGVLGTNYGQGVFQGGLFKEPELLKGQFFISKDSFDMIMQVFKSSI